MGRRGEGQFVAIEVNLRGDAKIGRMVRLLGVTRNEAVGMIAAWRELVLTRGEGLSGVLKSYPAEDIAYHLDWIGKGRKPDKLIAALTAANEIASRRGTFRHPHWADTPTGWYAAKRAGDRDRKRNVQGTSAEAPRSGDGGSTPIPSGSGQEVSKGPPGPPVPGGVEGVADARNGLTEWFLECYPRLKNQGIVRKMLGAMTEPEAAQLRYALPRQLPRYIAGMTGRAGRGVPFADKYLREGYYLEIRPPKPKVPKHHQNGHQTKAEELQEKREMIQRHEALWAKRDTLAETIKARAGRRLEKHELEALIDEEIEREEQQQGGSPS